MAARKKRSTRRPAGVGAKGRLKKGYRYAKGGRVVKAAAKRTTTRRRRARR